MKYLIVLFLVATTARAVRMEQVLVEEPTATNRDAAVWSSAPLATQAATREYLRTLMATSAYQAALTRVSAILSETTERFSTDWSYVFTKGGGIKVDTLEVRSVLDIVRSPFTVGSIEARYLSVTNSGHYGSIMANTASLIGTTNAPVYSSASVVTTGVFSTSYLSGGEVTFDSPAVLFTKPPLLFRTGDADGDGWSSSSSIKYVGVMSLGNCYDGLMRLDKVNTSLGVANALSGMGINASIHLYESPTGDNYSLSGTTNIPVVVSHYPTAEPLFLTGFWKRSPDAADAANIVLTSAVSRCFAILATNEALAYINGGTNVAMYASVASLNIDSPSLPAVFRVSDWHVALTNTVAEMDETNVTSDVYSGVTNLTLAVDAYVSATEILLDPTTGLLRETAEHGVVAIAMRRSSTYINYSKFRQMIPDAAGYYRVSMQLSFADPTMLPSATPARYWLTMNGKKLLSHKVSASGETGPAFAFIDATSTTPGYLYLDMSDFVAIHGINVLKGAVYYVKLEALRGLDLWHSQ